MGCYLPLLGVVKLLVLESGRRVNLDTPFSFALVVVVPMTATFTYFLGVFSFGFSGNLTGRQSMYPARAFTLPISAAGLAGWPMLYGTAAMAILWMATRLLAIWPSDIAVPNVWPGILAASLLAWTQALTWMPYLAYLTARYAVARARRGDTPDWEGAFAGLGPVAGWLTRRRARFSSATAAQTWFEWRRHGRSLPTWIAILLPAELALLFVADNAPALVFSILGGALLTPPIMAVFTARAFRRSHPAGNESSGLAPFIAIRPLTGAELIAAKLKATAWSTAAAWALVLLAIPAGLAWSGAWPVVASKVRQASEQIGMSRVAVVGLLLISGLILATWKQLVQSLYIGVSGRQWLIKGSICLTLALLVVAGPIIQWIGDDPRLQHAFWNYLPMILAVLVCAKMSAAAWIALRLYRDRLLRDRTLVGGAAAWCIVVLALYGLFVWFFSTPLMPRYILALVAILAIPLARLAAAPLALAWNRHR